MFVLQGLGGRTLGCRATLGGQQGSKALKAAQVLLPALSALPSVSSSVLLSMLSAK